MLYFFVGTTVLAVGALIATICLNHFKEKKLFMRLNHMLDSAMSGEFSEDSFDESMMSAYETRLYRHLCACIATEKNLSVEKERIKELISDISHQTKTPIANILLYSQLLEEQNSTSQRQDCLVALCEQAKKLRFLIDSLIKTSRLETGIITLHPQYNAVQPMILQAVHQITAKARQKQLSIRCKETKEYALFDEKWTAEAVYNILDNAVKYTPQGGEIKINIEQYSLFCRIDISDTGSGIPEEEQSKVFQRFYRGKKVSQIEGVGIGLFLAREIIHGQEGYIKVSSKEGLGATFSVFLPRDAR